MNVTRPLLTTMLACAAAPAGGHAQAPDRVVGEATLVQRIAVHGTTVAWTTESDGGAVTVHLRVGGERERAFAAGTGSLGVDLGRDERGRVTLVYPRCTSVSRCVVRLVDVKTRCGQVVAGLGPGKVSLPVLGDGRLAWADDSKRVFIRSLRSGRTFEQSTGRRKLFLDGLDFDGRRIALTGDPGDGLGASGEASELRVGNVGSSRIRTLQRHDIGEESHNTVAQPMLSATAADATGYDEDGYGNEGITRYPLGSTKKRFFRAVGTSFSQVARGGGRVAYSTTAGLNCAVSTRPCARVVLAGADPFGAQARLLTPQLELDKASGPALAGRLFQRVFADGRRGELRGLAGVRVRVIRVIGDPGSERFAEKGGDAVTGADGRFAVQLPPDAKPRNFAAYTIGFPVTTFTSATRRVPGQG